MSLLIENYANVVAAANQTSAPVTGSTRVSGAVYAPVARYDASTETVPVYASDYIIVATHNGEVDFDLPAAADNVGRILILRSNSGEAIFSSASNVNRPGAGSSLSISNELAYDEYQAWVQIQSDGSYWNIINGYAQAYD